MEEEDIKGLKDYLAILRRRKRPLFLPMVLILVASIAAALTLPAKYRSTATILIEKQEIPSEMVRSSVTSYADQRIQVISQRVMTTQNLNEIIEKYDLYPEERRRESLEQVIGRMREAIALEMISADVVDPRSGRPTEATIAFTLSYESKSPDLAQKVANELVSLFLTENIETRTQMAADTSSFLGTEAEKLSDRISDLEQKLAEFKQRNVGNLPEMVNVNLELMDRTDRQLLETESQIRSLKEREIYLESELIKTSPNALLYSDGGERILTSEDRLKSLKAQYVSAASRLSADHPDIMKMRKEIAALRAEVHGTVDTTELERRLASERSALEAARKRYLPAHPDVKKLEASVAGLEKQVQRAGAVFSGPLPTTRPDNPAYIQLQARLNAAQTEIRALEHSRDKLKAKLANYEARLIMAPLAEREYRLLTRDYENALTKYREIRSKQMEAQLSEKLERERKGERFVLIEPPLLPEEPVSPNRPAILFLGLVFSIAGGIGTAAVTESMDQTVRDVKDLRSLTNAHPLAVISTIETLGDQRRRLRIRILIVTLIVAVIGAAVAAVHVWVMPLDVLWFTVLRRLDALALRFR
jgi:uncharacterized protein involved in exopolysaccharide biosynthesis